MKNYQRCLCQIISTIFSLSILGTAEIYNFDYSNIENIEIEGALFNIDIKGESRTDVSGKIETEHDNILYHKQSGKTLKIWYERPFMRFLPFKKNNLFLKVPSSTNVNIENSSGNVEVTSLVSESLTVKTSSGKVKISNIEANIALSASSGDIIVSEIVSQNEVTLTTSSGRIVMENSKADINAKSSSGKQNYNNITGNIVSTASSADIVIHSQTGLLNIRTTSGKIKGDAVTLTENSSFNSTSGEIYVLLNRSLDNYTFKLSSTSGMLYAGSVKAKGELTKGDGSIFITANSSSGTQHFRESK